jgi:hypothetical protein
LAIERRGEFEGNRPVDLDAQVAPPAIDTIALILRGKVESADESDGVIAHDHFSMVPKAETSE